MTCCTPTPASSGRRWSRGWSSRSSTRRTIPNLADVYPYAVSDKIVGVSRLHQRDRLRLPHRQGARRRRSRGRTSPIRSIAGARGSYIIPVNSLGQMHLMMLGKLYGKGLTDLDAAYKALEQLKPIKMYDFTGGMEKALLSAEVNIGVLHDSGIYRYDGQNQPIEFAAPSEGVLVARAGVEHHARLQGEGARLRLHRLHPAAGGPEAALPRRCGIRPPNRKVKLDAEIRRQALQHRGEGGAADPGRLEMVQRAQGRHRRARDPDPARVSLAIRRRPRMRAIQ